MTDEELDAATEGLQFMLDQYRDKQSWEGYPKKLRDGIAAITTLRAQLAEARAEWDGLAVDLGFYTEDRDFHKARADRAEAALAAQIEVEPVAWRWESCANSQGWNTRYGCVEPKPSPYIADVIPLYAAKPHDRTALDRMLAETREKALREAAEEADELADEVDRGHDWGERASARILALITEGDCVIEKEKLNA